MSLPNLIKTTRQYFGDLGFEEIIVPTLHPSLPLEPNIYAFSTKSLESSTEFYLTTSPESTLKKALAKGCGNCFAITPCFRNLESSGPHHRPEFLMLEWYEINKNHQDLMISVKKYLDNFLKLKYSEFKIPENNFDNEPDFNQFFLNEIEPQLPSGGVFVTGYPTFLTPMAKPNERFELYINGVEIANGNTENLDSKSVLLAFQNEQNYRQAHNLPSHPIDYDLVDAIAKIPPCAGVGLGLERLAMIMDGSSTIS